MIAITSRQALLELHPHLPRCKKIVYDYVNKNPKSSNKQISVGTDLDLNNVTGRVNELVADKVLKFSERTPCPITGRRVYKWELRNAI